MTDPTAAIRHNLPPRIPAGDVFTLWLSCENRGTETWRPEDVKIVIDLDGARLAQLDLPHAVAPGDRATLHWVFRVVDHAGRHEFKIDLSNQQGIAAQPVPVEIVKQPLTATRRLRDRVFETHARTWLPCDGMSWSGTGPGYPQFAREAAGYRITDLEGRRYVDYLMGWGSALLGYANKRIQRAVKRELGSAGILTLTHHRMPEVGDMLCSRFPGAEAATFGKNGSDVCTAAARMARVYTGRQVVLFCGFHGWQDWYAERIGFAATGIPPRSEPLLAQFAANDLAQVSQLFDAHRGQVAAVMLEPAGVIEGSNGPIQDADPAFLREVAELAHKEGALVIFDEIMTGFRYRGGSVQQATGVVPDLTCLGKALSAGMPLSALIGKREVFTSTIGRIFYEPTFKGEAYSFAAAREALRIYQEQDVPSRIWSFGNRLREMVDRTFASAGIPATLIGPPFRMLLTFAEEDPRRRTLMRTLVQQELLKNGVLTTQNLFLPSTAHDDKALEITRRAFERAVEALAAAMKGDRFVSYLEIPPLPG